MKDETGLPHPSNNTVEIRALVKPTRTEIEQLAMIFERYRAHYGEGGDASRAANWLEGNLSSGRLDAFVAQDNGVFIGFATTMAVPASLRLGHFWQIRDLFVVPTHRRLGVGRSLLDFVRTAANDVGALRVVLQTEAENTSALRLYEQSGYTIVEGYLSLTLPLNSNARET